MKAARISLGAAIAALGLALGAGALASQQQTPAPPAATPSVPVDVTACQACHGENGISRNPRIPNIAGQQQAYLAAQLEAFRAGTRRSDSMQAIAAQLNDAEIAALAAYWHSRPATVPAGAHGATAAGPAIPSRMSFPADFPAGFTSYERTTAENGTTTERYVNAAALAAARAGRPLPDGSTILAVNRDAAGAITSYAGMAAISGRGDSVPALLRNGNWDYALFDAARARNERLNQAPCLACHRPQASNSFVFTLPAIRTRAQQPGS
jgi:cytochrome c553